MKKFSQYLSSVKIISNKKARKKAYSYRSNYAGQALNKLAHNKFGFLAKKVNLAEFLKNFVTLTLRAEKHQAIKQLIYLKTYRG